MDSPSSGPSSRRRSHELVYPPEARRYRRDPLTKPYREQLWAELADARHCPIDASLQIFEGVLARLCHFLNTLSPSDWSRTFTNPDWGTLTVEDTLRGMAWHSRHHTAHITELRKREGW